MSGTREPVCRMMHQLLCLLSYPFNFETKFISKHYIFFFIILFLYNILKQNIALKHSVSQQNSCIYATGKVKRNVEVPENVEESVERMMMFVV